MTENEPTFDFCSFIEQECAKAYDAKKKFLIKILFQDKAISDLLSSINDRNEAISNQEA
jgi:hypothetical protein